MIFFTSDLHIGHDKDFIYGVRGFSSIDVYGNQVIANINEVVGENDHLYILGDLILGNNEMGIELLKKIKCKHVHVILGNHDSPKRIELYKELPNFIIEGYALRFKYKKKMFMLSHYPMITSNRNDESIWEKVYCLCGHTHTTNKWEHFEHSCYHVDLDCHDNYPISIDEIIEDIRDKRNERE